MPLALFRCVRLLSVQSSSSNPASASDSSVSSSSQDSHSNDISGFGLGSGINLSGLAGNPPNNSNNGSAVADGSSSQVTLELVSSGRCGDHRFLAGVCSNNALILRHARQTGRAEHLAREGTSSSSSSHHQDYAEQRKVMAEVAAASLEETKPVVRVIPWLTERPGKRIVAMSFNSGAAAQWLLCVTLDCSVVLIPVYYLLVRSGGAAAVAAASAEQASADASHQRNSKRSWFGWGRSTDAETFAGSNQPFNDGVADVVDGAGRSLTDLTIIRPSSKSYSRHTVATDGLWWQAKTGQEYAVVSTSNGLLLFYDLNTKQQEPLAVRLKSPAVRVRLVGPTHGQTHLVVLTDRDDMYKILLEYEDADAEDIVWHTIVDAYKIFATSSGEAGHDWADLSLNSANAHDGPLAPFRPVSLPQMAVDNVELALQTEGAVGEDWVVLNTAKRRDVAPDASLNQSSERAAPPGSVAKTIRGPIVSRFFQHQEQVVGAYYAPRDADETSAQFGGMLRVFDGAEIREHPMFEYSLPTHTHVRTREGRVRVNTMIQGVFMTDKFVFGVDPGSRKPNFRKRPGVYVMSKHLLGQTSQVSRGGNSSEENSRANPVLQTLELPAGSNVRGVLPPLSVIDSADSTRMSPLLHDPADLPAGCLVWTDDGVYEIRPIPNAGQNLFSYLVAHDRDAVAEPLGKTLGLDVPHLYEIAADDCFARSDFRRALSLYQRSNVDPEKLVKQFAGVGRIDAIVQFCQDALNMQSARLPRLRKVRVSNMLFCALVYSVAMAQTRRGDNDAGLIDASRARLLTFCETNLDFDLEQATSLVFRTYVDVQHALDGSARSSQSMYVPRGFDMFTLAVELNVRALHVRSQIPATTKSSDTSAVPAKKVPDYVLLRPVFDGVLVGMVKSGLVWQLGTDQLSWALQWSLAEGMDVLSNPDAIGLREVMPWLRGGVWRRSLELHCRSPVLMPLNSEALSTVLLTDLGAIRDAMVAVDRITEAALGGISPVASVTILRWLSRATQKYALQTGQAAARRDVRLLSQLLLLHVRILLSLARLYCFGISAQHDTSTHSIGGPGNLAECEQALAMATLRTVDSKDLYEPLALLFDRYAELAGEDKFSKLSSLIEGRLHDMHHGFSRALHCRWRVCGHEVKHACVDGMITIQCAFDSFKTTVALRSIPEIERPEQTRALLTELLRLRQSQRLLESSNANLEDSLLKYFDGDEPSAVLVLSELCRLALMGGFETLLEPFSAQFWQTCARQHEARLMLDLEANNVDNEARIRKLWSSVCENLTKNSHARAYATVSTVSLEPKPLLAGNTVSRALTEASNSTVIFTCGHRVPSSEFSATVAALVTDLTRTGVDEQLSASGSEKRHCLPLGATSRTLATMFRRVLTDPQPLACPDCVRAWVFSESNSVLEQAASSALSDRS